MPPLPTARVRIQLPASSGRDRSYEVVIGSGLLESLGALLPLGLARSVRRAFVVFDDLLPREYLQAVEESLGALGVGRDTLGVRASEAEKSWTTAGVLLKAFADARLERDEPVIALGGGVIGDVAGFAAAVYRRGVPVIQCPTTLLAMVDASVGGKAGVNLTIGSPGDEQLAKNLVGAFHQPRLVVIDTATLKTLAPRHVSAGLAECVKHALMCESAPEPDCGLTEWTQTNLAKVRALESAVTAELVSRHVTLKAKVVAQDEREEASDQAGGRALLNLGHTFAHAIETLDGLALPNGSPLNLLHGEAVGLGLIAAARTARVLGLCDLDVEEAARQMLGAAGLPTAIVGLPEGPVLLARMSHDKKSRGGALRLVLPIGVGAARVVADPPIAAVIAGIDAIRG